MWIVKNTSHLWSTQARYRTGSLGFYLFTEVFFFTEVSFITEVSLYTEVSFFTEVSRFTEVSFFLNSIIHEMQVLWICNFTKLSAVFQILLNKYLSLECPIIYIWWHNVHYTLVYTIIQIHTVINCFCFLRFFP